MIPRRSPQALLLATLALIGPATSAQAALSLTVLNSTASAGGSGSFDVVLSSDGGNYNVSGFSFELRVAVNSGVLFTGVDGTTAAPYIFGAPQNPPLSSSTFPTTDFIAGDDDFTPPYSVTVTQGSTFGLGHVTYTVAAGAAPGPINVAFVGTSGTNRTTQVLDANGNIIPITASNGTITIASAVPEPASALLAALGLVGTAGLAALSARRGR